MYGRWESGAKIDVAQRLMGQMLDSLQGIQEKGNFQLALRVYGHQKPVPPQDCSDTRLEVPFSNGNIYKIKRVLKAIKPKGTMSIQLVVKDFKGTWIITVTTENTLN